MNPPPPERATVMNGALVKLIEQYGPDIVRKAICEHGMSSKFFPAPAEINALCREISEAPARAAAEAKIAAYEAEQKRQRQETRERRDREDAERCAAYAAWCEEQHRLRDAGLPYELNHSEKAAAGHAYRIKRDHEDRELCKRFRAPNARVARERLAEYERRRL